jgi:hypothetical protein
MRNIPFLSTTLIFERIFLLDSLATRFAVRALKADAARVEQKCERAVAAAEAEAEIKCKVAAAQLAQAQAECDARVTELQTQLGAAPVFDAMQSINAPPTDFCKVSAHTSLVAITRTKSEISSQTSHYIFTFHLISSTFMPYMLHHPIIPCSAMVHRRRDAHRARRGAGAATHRRRETRAIGQRTAAPTEAGAAHQSRDAGHHSVSAGRAGRCAQ